MVKELRGALAGGVLILLLQFSSLFGGEVSRSPDLFSHP